MTLRRLVLLLPLVAGCSVDVPPLETPPTAAALARYPARTDLMAVKLVPGAPPRWFSPGYPPLRSLRVAPRTPDPEFVDRLRPSLGKEILDPTTGLSELQRDDVARLLDRDFGTPASPAVRVPTPAMITELFDAPEDKKERAKLLAQIAPAEATRASLGLDDAALARGSVVYRRWCVQCHGATGGGDEANAIGMAAPPRDYRQGLYKFVTTDPTGPHVKNRSPQARKGKPCRDDLKRTVRNGLDGSMMPPFPNIPDRDLDDLVSYVIHLSVRGETEFEVLAKVMKPGEDDPDFVGQELEKLFASQLLGVLTQWGRAADDQARIPVPPEIDPNDTHPLESARRGFKLFNEKGCLGCHASYGRDLQLKYDKWATVVQPRNLLLGVYRGGRRGEDLFARIYGGIDPSTMPDASSWYKPEPGKPDVIWDLVHFLQVLADPTRRRELMEFDPSIKIEP